MVTDVVLGTFLFVCLLFWVASVRRGLSTWLLRCGIRDSDFPLSRVFRVLGVLVLFIVFLDRHWVGQVSFCFCCWSPSVRACRYCEWGVVLVRAYGSTGTSSLARGILFCRICCITPVFVFCSRFLITIRVWGFVFCGDVWVGPIFQTGSFAFPFCCPRVLVFRPFHSTFDSHCVFLRVLAQTLPFCLDPFSSVRPPFCLRPRNVKFLCDDILLNYDLFCL